jgi:hypothetical protein
MHDHATSDHDDLALRAAGRARAAVAMLLQSETVELRTSTAAPAGLAAAAPAACRLGVSGPPDGSVWVTVGDAASRRVAEAMAPGVDVDEELLGSVRAELANIVAGSFLTELGDGIGALLEQGLATEQPGADAQAEVAASGGTSGPGAAALVLGCEFSDSSTGDEVSMLVVLDGHGLWSRSTKRKE